MFKDRPSILLTAEILKKSRIVGNTSTVLAMAFEVIFLLEINGTFIFFRNEAKNRNKEEKRIRIIIKRTK